MREPLAPLHIHPLSRCKCPHPQSLRWQLAGAVLYCTQGSAANVGAALKTQQLPMQWEDSEAARMGAAARAPRQGARCFHVQPGVQPCNCAFSKAAMRFVWLRSRGGVGCNRCVGGVMRDASQGKSTTMRRVNLGQCRSRQSLKQVLNGTKLNAQARRSARNPPQVPPPPLAPLLVAAWPLLLPPPVAAAPALSRMKRSTS